MPSFRASLGHMITSGSSTRQVISVTSGLKPTTHDSASLLVLLMAKLAPTQQGRRQIRISTQYSIIIESALHNVCFTGSFSSTLTGQRSSLAEDVLVMKDEANPTWLWGVGVSDPDGRYLTLNISRDTARKSLFWITDLQTNEIGSNMKWLKLVDRWEADYNM
jgi:Prolyl oligopeptidase, N-terminal beta-propeller domain